MSEINENPVLKIEKKSSDDNLETDKYGFKGGSQYTNPESEIISAKLIRKRELKWLDMLDNWDKWMAKKFKQVKKRCRKGIPSSLRGRAWQALSGSRALQAENERNDITFQNLLQADLSETVVEDISKDLHRQFPFHEMFSRRGGNGQQDLSDVLTAYAAYNRIDGYCQAQAPIAAALLMHMPSEEAFWCMVALFEYYIRGYFSPGLEVVQIDGNVMQGLLKEASPLAYKHLEKHHVSPMLYCTEWFMCIFARTLPWPSVLRLWDVFFCEGVKVVFRCGIILIRETLEDAKTLSKLPGLYETMEHLKKIDQACMQPEFLMREVNKLRINEQDLSTEHKLQQKKLRKSNPNQHQIKRVYRYKPVHQSAGLTHKKQYASAISVNSPSINQQAIQPVVRKKSFTIDTKNRERKDSFLKRRDSQNTSPKSVQLTRFNTIRETEMTSHRDILRNGRNDEHGGIVSQNDGISTQNNDNLSQNDKNSSENDGTSSQNDDNLPKNDRIPSQNGEILAQNDENIPTDQEVGYEPKDQNSDTNSDPSPNQNNNSSNKLSSNIQSSPQKGSNEPNEITYKTTLL